MVSCWTRVPLMVTSAPDVFCSQCFPVRVGSSVMGSAAGALSCFFVFCIFSRCWNGQRFSLRMFYATAIWDLDQVFSASKAFRRWRFPSLLRLLLSAFCSFHMLLFFHLPCACLTLVSLVLFFPMQIYKRFWMSKCKAFQDFQGPSVWHSSDRSSHL